jgi:folate-dependent phosphoribosylglycinamide formyltransferase PurN
MELTPFWVSFFSQSGKEIYDISQKLNRWPDLIITNKRPDHLRTIHPRLVQRVVYVDNKPTEKDLLELLEKYKNPIVTLHGWLRVMPESICNRYKIFNGHPGLITKYEHLKGKDPQIRAYNEKLPIAGAVLHKVTPGVDEGEVLMWDSFLTEGLTLDDFFLKLRERSLRMWVDFLKKNL